MGRLSDHATAMDIIAQLHASLLLCSFLRMAAGELTKRAALWTVLVCTSVQNRICMCVCVDCFCLCLAVCVNTSMCVSMHVLRVLVYGVSRVCVHACRMTFSEMWQREKKHLTHNWSAMKEIWSWICIRLTCSALKPAAAARGSMLSSVVPYHPEGWLQRSKWYSTKMTEGNTAHSRRAILMTKSIGRSALISIKKRVSGWM